jgi:hypothetical protein
VETAEVEKGREVGTTTTGISAWMWIHYIVIRASLKGASHLSLKKGKRALLTTKGVVATMKGVVATMKGVCRHTRRGLTVAKAGASRSTT